METKGKNKTIKIFVSHRIDKESQIIDNPLYVNVRCGAFFDKNNNSNLLGDNTGDNISQKRMTFNDLTVMYWAWKNVESDYYGLCHYRRYFSFDDTLKDSGEFMPSKAWCVVEKELNKETAKKYHMDDAKFMSDIIEQYDVITIPKCNLSRVHKKNLMELIGREVKNPFFDYKDFEKSLMLIKELFPEIHQCAIDYCYGKDIRSYNVSIMKKEYFFGMCDFVFSILFKLEKDIDISNYSLHKSRTYGFIAEHLIGIYLKYLEDDKKLKFKELPLVFFEDTDKEPESLVPAFQENNIAIVISSSNYYVPYLSVCIKSIINNSTSNYNYDIIVLNKNITNDNKDKLKKIATSNNVSIRFYNISKKIKNLHFFVNSERISEETYYGLLTPWIFLNYKKFVIMDADMLVRKNIAELYNTNIGNNFAGVVNDVTFYGMLNNPFADMEFYAKNTLKLKNPFDFFNGGLLLLNANEIRKEINFNAIADLINNYEFRIVDQDIFNMLLEGRVLFLDLKWNIMTKECPYQKETIDLMPLKWRERYLDSYSSPFIVHFAGYEKPWNNAEMDYADEFWLVARQTEFYEILLQRMATTSKSDIYDRYEKRINRLEKVTLIYFLRKFRNFLKIKIPANTLLGRNLRKIWHKIHK